MKKVIISLAALVAIASYSFAQTLDTGSGSAGITKGSERVNFDISTTNSVNNDLVIQNAETGRTQVRVLPGGSGDAAFLEVLNNSDFNNAGKARLGIRNEFAVFSIFNQGSPATGVKNFAIELDQFDQETGEAFVVTTAGINGGAMGSTSTILAKVDVAGLSTIEAKVEAAVSAPDYVFEDDYELPSIEEVENYINENKHLPEMPSAAEFEANGIKLGKMTFDLLKQIEHQQLYIIELNKELNNLKAKVDSLEENK